MMRLDNNSSDRGLLSAATPYSSLETMTRSSEFDMPMSRSRTGEKRCYAASVCVTLCVVAAIMSATIVSVKKSHHNSGNGGPTGDDPSTRNTHAETLAPAPSPAYSQSEGPPSPPAPVAPPPSKAPAPSQAFAPSALFAGDESYQQICKRTINNEVCLSIFASNPNAPKVDLQQWTIMTMEAAETSVNESYSLALNMKKANAGNDALQQCLEVFADSLDQLNTSMYLVADMNLHHPGSTGTDVQTYMSAAMTDQDTCQEGISEVGGWPGSDMLGGTRADHVNAVLSISLTFVNSLTASTMDTTHHRRLLHAQPHKGGSILGRRGLLSSQESQRSVQARAASL